MMAVEGIGALVQILSDQLREQTLNSQAGANTPGTGNSGKVAVVEDTFTPSTQSNAALATPQDAVIFQVSQGALTGVTASILFAQTNPNAAPGGAQTPAAASKATNAGNEQPAAAPNPITPVIPGQLFVPAPAGQAPAVQAAPSTNEQAKILALNSGLPAFGLSKVEIQEIDRLAARIQNFNPATYTNLVNQFEALAQQGTQLGTANPAANAGTVGSPNTTPNTKAIGSGSQA
jgi:hypothetical protein